MVFLPELWWLGQWLNGIKKQNFSEELWYLVIYDLDISSFTRLSINNTYLRQEKRDLPFDKYHLSSQRYNGSATRYLGINYIDLVTFYVTVICYTQNRQYCCYHLVMPLEIMNDLDK